MKKMLPALISIPVMAGLGACCGIGQPSRTEITAVYTPASIELDGRLDEPQWKTAPEYSFIRAIKQLEKKEPGLKNGIVEPGKVRLLWDDRYLYIGFEFTDMDIVAESDKDQEFHFRSGDTVEIFLKPLNRTWYWECYVTPKGCKTSFFYPGRGRLGLPGCTSARPALPGMKAAASVKGTLNYPWDKDVKWTAEAAIPLSELSIRGEDLQPGAAWLIFFGRYNYGRYLSRPENSSFPQQIPVAYHDHEDYGSLKMIKPVHSGRPEK